MAINILGYLPFKDISFLLVDANPKTEGLAAEPSSLAFYSNKFYVKRGTGDTDWEELITESNSPNQPGQQLYLPIYSGDSTGRQIDDVVAGPLTGTTSVKVTDGANNIIYNFPRPDVANADVVLTEGNQDIYGNKTFHGNVSVLGAFATSGVYEHLYSNDLSISDSNVIINKGGTAATAVGAGFTVEADAAAAAWVNTSASGWQLRSLASANKLNLNMTKLSADREVTFQNVDSDLVGCVPGAEVVTAVPFMSGSADAWRLDNHSTFTYVKATSTLGVVNLTIGTQLKVSALGAGIAHIDADGVFSSSTINLATDTYLVGTLPISRGGTNSNVALNNNRVMVSVAGAIVENAALLPNGKILFTDANGLPTSDANFSFGSSKLSVPNVDISSVEKLVCTGTSFYARQMFETTTTDGVAKSAVSIPIATDTAVKIRVHAVARRTGGIGGVNGASSAYERIVRVKNVAGVVSLPRPVSTAFDSETAGEQTTNWDCTVIQSGTNAVVQVTGAANVNVAWGIMVELLVV